jgi:thiol-disulfide isomerase/thioredoxin
MEQALVLGPLSFPLGMLLALAAMALGPFAGEWMARRAGVDIGSLVFRMMVAGLLAARLGYIVQYWDAYRQSPLSMLDVRDGGWRPWIGVAAALIAAIVVGARRPLLRKPLAAAFGAAGLVWLLGTLALSALSNEQGTLPTASLRSLGGENVALSSFTGKPTVVNLWATWCPPCRREMPVLQQAQASRTDVNFVFLNQGESAEKVRAFLAAQHWPLQNVLLDGRGEVAGELGVRGLPTTLFYDAAGRLVDVRVGELSVATLAQRLGEPKTVTTPSR